MYPDNVPPRIVPGSGPRAFRLLGCILLVLLGGDLLFRAAPGAEPSLRLLRPDQNSSRSETEQFEFLFDDEWIDDKRGVRRVTGSPSKLSGPVFKGERDWEKSAIHPTMGLFYDPELRKFRMWYKAVSPRRTAEAKTGRAADPSEQQADERYFICYAESQDGVNWVRPSVGRFVFNGNSYNNILEEIAPGDSVFHTVVKDPFDPDSSRRYKAIGFQTGGVSSLKANPTGGSGLYVRYSADGLAWPKPAALVMSTTDLTDSNGILPQRDPVSGSWVGFFRPRTSPKRRFIGYSESRDFDHWTYPRMLMTPDKQDAEPIEFYGIAATVLGSWRLASLWVFHNNPAFSPVTNELVYSRDGQRYQRALPGHEFIPLGSVGSFDSRTVYPLAWVERASEFFLYYSGSNLEHGSDRGMKMQREIRTPKGETPVWGIGMARLPWGHFCGLRAELDGMVETKWLTNYGEGGLRAVAAVQPDGFIQAEILDQYGKVIPGWQRETSQTRTGDRGRLFFTWKPTGLEGRFGQTSDQGGKVGHVVKLRFYLHKATLFGFQLGRPGSRPDDVEAPSTR